jgi:hypothetical protein
MNGSAAPATCTCPCYHCRRAMVLDEGPLGIVRDYYGGACECGLPAEDEFWADGEFWRTCETCRTRWYAGNHLSDDFEERRAEVESAPWKLATYREIPGEEPDWITELRVDWDRVLMHLINTVLKVSHDPGLCSQHHDHDVSEDD